jgi:GT2 family glycosyltransferase
MLTLSIVSHGHGTMLNELLRDLEIVAGVPFEVLLTLNIPEPDPVAAAGLRYPLRIIRNAQPRGFGANHNAAFGSSTGDFFCVLNPDVRLNGDPFPTLLQNLAQPNTGVVAPAITNAAGLPEPTARRFPSPLSILRKALLGAPRQEYEFSDTPLDVDWVSGVFMLFRRPVYERLGGFDERYFLYYEDVDLCARLRALGLQTRVVPAATAQHAARHDSHRNWRYTRWHLTSMLRFFSTHY